MKTAAATRKAAHAPVRAPSRTNVRFAITLAVQSVNWRGIRPTRAVSFSQCSARQLGLKPSDAPLPAPLFAFRRSARRPCAFSIQSNPAPSIRWKSLIAPRSASLARRVAGADQFDLCATSRREPEVSSGWALPVVERGRGARASGRRVRGAEYCASFKSAAVKRVQAFTPARSLIPAVRRTGCAALC